MTDDLDRPTPDHAGAEEFTEWGVRWPDGSITSCGWMDGPSEGWARKSLHPNERFVNPTQQVGEAIVRRTRIRYPDTVTEWEEVPDDRP
jgi:rubredoxin